MANGLSGANLKSLRVLWDFGTSSGLDDGALLARFVDRRDGGAELAFEALVRRHGAMVLRVCEQLLVDRHAAEDAFQAVFLVLARRAGSIRRPEQLAPWLHGVAHRTAKEARSRERKRRGHELRGATMPSTTTGPPEHPLIRAEEAEALHGEIARLPERYRSPVVLCDLEGLTHQEAASRLRCPTGTVAIRLKRARERLRARLTRRGLDPSSGLMITLDPSKLPALPTTLVQSTIRGSMAVGLASASVISLAEGVQWTMTLAKWKTATATAGLVLALGLAATWAASGHLPSRPVDGPPRVAPTLEIEVGKPIAREVRDYEDFVGRLEASRSEEVKSQVTGVLGKARPAEGDRVKAGELLFEVDRSPYQATLEAAEGDVLKAEARVKLAMTVVARNKRLQERGSEIVSRQEVDRGVSELAVAKASLSTAEAARDRADRDLDSTRIRSAFDGEVARRLVNPGDPIKAGQTTLAKLVATDPMAVVFDVDERTLLGLRRQLWDNIGFGLVVLPIQVGLADETGFPHRGSARFFGEAVDPTKGTARLSGTVPNPDRFLIPGLFARVRLRIGKPYQALLVPDAAVLTDQGRKFLYVLDDQDQIERRPVTLGQLEEDLRVVREGLKPGDRFLLIPSRDLKPGSHIKPRLTLPAKP